MLNNCSRFNCRCYEANSDQYFLIFEDLVANGYRNTDRRIGLTMDNFKSVFLILAKWHATTAILMQTVRQSNLRKRINYISVIPLILLIQEPHIISPFVNIFSTTFFEALIKSILKTTAQFTEEYVSGYQKLKNKLEALSEEIFPRLQKSMERSPKEFNCLCHIDLWTNNIMFNQNLRSTNTSLLIDFQMVYAGSPVLDICYSLFSSSDLSMREKEFDALLYYYQGQLSSILKKLGYKNEIPTLETLQSQILKRGIYAVPLGIFGTVGRYSEENDENNLELLVSETEEGKRCRLNIFKNQKCRDKLLFLLNYFDSKGYFDI